MSKNITNYSDLETLLKKENSKVIVMCSTSWCGPCKKIKPELEKMSTDPDNTGIDFAYVDCEQFSDPDEKILNFVRGYPTFFSYYKGLIRCTLSGASLDKLRQMTQELNSYT